MPRRPQALPLPQCSFLPPPVGFTSGSSPRSGTIFLAFILYCRGVPFSSVGGCLLSYNPLPSMDVAHSSQGARFDHTGTGKLSFYVPCPSRSFSRMPPHRGCTLLRRVGMTQPCEDQDSEQSYPYRKKEEEERDRRVTPDHATTRLTDST